MDIKNIGKIVKRLREEKGWSQQELADKIPISRESISKWEKSRNIPDYQSLIRISEIFNVSVDELLIGEKKGKKDNSILIKNLLQLYDEKNKLKKIIIQISIILVCLIFVFLSYYFINSYNSIRVYNVGYDDSEISIKNGVFITTNEKTYFRLGDIFYKSEREVKYLKLYFKDYDGNDQLILGLTNGDLIIVEDFGYNEYFNCDEIDYIVENLYLNIEFEDEIKSIKLQLEEIFSNDNLLFSKTKSI